MSVDVTLARTTEGPVVELAFANTGPDPVFLARPRLSEELMDGDYFDFLPRRPPYRGRSVKRTSYPESALISLGGGETIRTSIDLSRVYGLSGTEEEVRYVASHPLYGQVQPTVCLMSPWLSLRAGA